MGEQEIRFTEVGGRRVAWARSGEGPPLVFSGFWMSHLELNWRDPRFRAFAEALGEHRTVIRYDPPGTGASADGDLPSASVEDGMEALATVVEALGAEQVDLFAGSSGAPIGIAYAAANPRSVRGIALYGGYASGAKIASPRARRAIVELVREHWGLGSRALADIFMPSADAGEREGFVTFQREAASAETAARSLEAVYGFDVASRLGAVEAPTAVIHRRGDRAIQFALGRELAEALPDASLLALDGDDHLPWFGDSETLVRVALRALGVEADAIPAVPASNRATPSPSRTQSAPEWDGLTARESEVLGLVASGLSDREIAERLVLSPHTVHRHIANVRTKLGLPTRAAAVAAAARRGLI